MNRTNYPALTAISSLAWMIAAGTTTADEPDPRRLLEKRVYCNAAGESLPYRLFVPRDYDVGKKYPLILFLHGLGERGDDNEAQLKHAEVLRFVDAALQKKEPCLLVAPQCPDTDKWVPTFFGVKPKKEPKEERPLAETPGGSTRALRLVMEMLDALEAEYSIDPDRRYATGLSMGGYGSYDLCLRRPDYFAAAVPVCGGLDPKEAPRLAHIPMWIFHGADDPVVPAKLSRDLVEALKKSGARKKAGADPKYTEYPGVGHNSWSHAYREPGLPEWLFQQRRAKR